MSRHGKWNGKSATVLRRDGDAVVIQVLADTSARGHTYERVLVVTKEQWLNAQGATLSNGKESSIGKKSGGVDRGTSR